MSLTNDWTPFFTTKKKEVKRKPIIECHYYSYCPVKNFGRINCITNYKDCISYKNYELKKK